MKKILQILFVILALIIGLYPAIYFIINRKFGLLQTKTDEVLLNINWNIAFYIHIIFGAIALLVGWTQFSLKSRTTNIKMHRIIGKLYICSVILSSLSGIYIGLFATGGFWASLGFITLAIIWFSSTLKAYFSIRKKQVILHQKMMIYSYAACFAAVTLRIWLPLLISILNDFTKAYIITAWVCWIPNIFVAYSLTNNCNET